jgi:hypothetical protein
MMTEQATGPLSVGQLAARAVVKGRHPVIQAG